MTTPTPQPRCGSEYADGTCGIDEKVCDKVGCKKWLSILNRHGISHGKYAAYTNPVAPVEQMQISDIIKDLEQSLKFYKDRVNMLQCWQSSMRDPERQIVCDILANGFTLTTKEEVDNAGKKEVYNINNILLEKIDSALNERYDKADQYDCGYRGGLSQVKVWVRGLHTNVLTPTREDLIEFARFTQKFWKEGIEIMRANNLKIESDTPMEKLAFTFYTNLCEIDSEASHLFQESYGEDNYKDERLPDGVTYSPEHDAAIARKVRNDVLDAVLKQSYLITETSYRGCHRMIDPKDVEALRNTKSGKQEIWVTPNSGGN